MKVYLAATEDAYRTKEEARVRLTVPHLLTSFIGKGGYERIDRAVQAAGPAQEWCLDSGAHFFLSAFYKHHKRPPVADAERHLASLLDTVRAAPVKPFFVVELDLQDLYGEEAVAAWRKDIFAPFEKETGVRVCYVWHAPDGQKGWDALLASDASYLGVGGPIGPKGLPLGVATRMMLRAYEAKKPVHGFAKVKGRLLRHVPFYSVDSTSWGAGVLYGTVHHFDHRTGEMRLARAGRSAFKSNPALAGGKLAIAARRVRASDMAGGSAGAKNLSSVYQESADAYREFEKWFTAYWKGRGVDWSARLGEPW